ncbi:MAG TPA: nucleotide exchange factor GrpE [bacterium]|nr:nucleotide exchange factor GrpE [bacterium]HPQ67125.1 nucleotide exchange factor GrpE [bacterium]
MSISRADYEQLMTKAAEGEDYRERMLRAYADLDNARKRLEKEKEEYLTFSNQDLVAELLPVLDNFQRALKVSQDEGDTASYRQGVEMIMKQLLEALSRQGLEEIECGACPFDPFLHEAVERVETADHPDGTIADEILRGYTFKGRLLRPSAVKVYWNPEEGGAGAEGNPGGE